MNIENANSHPYKVVLTKDTDEMYANSHPYQVEIVGGGGGTEGKVVDKLPEEGETGYIYLVLKEESEEGNIYDEYMWVLKQDDTYGWEHIGATNEVSIVLYDETGQNTDGAMTQKAVTDALNNAGGVKVLTTADYNWNSTNQSTSGTLDSFALWLLEDGLYSFATGIPISKIKTDKSNSVPGPTPSSTNQAPSVLVLSGVDNNSKTVKTFMLAAGQGSNGENRFIIVGTGNDGTQKWGAGGSVNQYGLTRSDVVNNLNGGGYNGNTIPLSANQGKVLNDKIGDIETILQTLTTGTGV